MVDRITPRTTTTLTQEIDAIFPGQKLNPIHAESFIQWVLEDNFAAPLPALTKVGVEIVDNGLRHIRDSLLDLQPDVVADGNVLVLDCSQELRLPSLGRSLGIHSVLSKLREIRREFEIPSR